MGLLDKAHETVDKTMDNAKQVIIIVICAVVGLALIVGLILLFAWKSKTTKQLISSAESLAKDPGVQSAVGKAAMM